MTEQDYSGKSVVMILIDGNRALVEDRPVGSSLENYSIFPSGGVEPEELDNPERTLIRELQEELGITPVIFYPLPSEEQVITSETGKLLLPYVVRSWKGDIPQYVLDKGSANPLHWEDLEVLSTYPLASFRQLVELVKKHLNP